MLKVLIQTDNPMARIDRFGNDEKQPEQSVADFHSKPRIEQDVHGFYQFYFARILCCFSIPKNIITRKNHNVHERISSLVVQFNSGGGIKC
jgi:hypothetical protein